MTHFMKLFAGIDPLLKLADSEYPVIQELALTALAKCTLDGMSYMPN